MNAKDLKAFKLEALIKRGNRKKKKGGGAKEEEKSKTPFYLYIFNRMEFLPYDNRLP